MAEMRKREWLTIYLPMALGTLLVLALVVLVAVLGFSEVSVDTNMASRVGDVAAIIVVVEAGLLSLIPLVILVACCALFFWLYIKIQPLLKQGQDITEQIGRKVDQAAGKATEQIIVKPYSWAARVQSIKQFIRR